MSASVSVLCPSGHTVTVKVAPNDPVLKIVEDACAKRKLDPAGHRRLLHHGKPLDLSLSIRFANLPNKANLELEKFESRSGASETVTVCLQPESGSRWQDDLPSDTSLWKALELANLTDGATANDGDEPVVVYMRKEVVGREELESTTLRKLGLTGGRVLLRFFYKQPKDLKDLISTGEIKTKVSTRAESPPRRAMRVDDGKTVIQRMREEAGGRKGDDSISTPKADEMKEPEPKPEPEPEKEKPPVAAPEPAVAPTSADAAEAEGDVEMEEAEPAKLVYIGDHNAVVFRIDGPSSSSVRVADLPDDFFDLTVDELKRLYKDKSRGTRNLEEGGMLTTQAFKDSNSEANKLARLQKYKKAVLRILFPDQHVLQATFLSGQTVGEVMSFLCQFLVDPSEPFQLVITPPRTVLSPEATLLDADCVPNNSLRFSRVGRQGECSEKTFLKPEFTDQLSNLAGAMQAIKESGLTRKNNPGDDKPSQDENLMLTLPSGSSAQCDDTSEASGPTGPKVVKSGGAIPKWFQKGKQ